MTKASINMSLFWMLLVCVNVLIVNGDSCLSDETLKKIITESTEDVQLNNLASLDGTWMVIKAPESEMKDIIASYSSFDLNEAKTELEVSVYDYVKTVSGAINMNSYFQSIKKKAVGSKELIWTGRYSDDSSINKQTFVFYSDKNALAFYSCDPALAMDKGWTVRVLVNAAKRSDLLAADDNPTKASLKTAEEKLQNMQNKEEKWKTENAGKFGLFGPIIKMNFIHLKPEDYKDTEQEHEGTIANGE